MNSQISIPSFFFPPDEVIYVAPTWNEMEQLTIAVSKQIINANKPIDLIVTLAKGGWPMTRSLADFLQIDEIASIGVKFYSGINERLPQPNVYQDLPIDVAGKNVLLFDDVADSGGSLQFVINLLKERKAASTQTATLFYKEHSVIKPDFFAYTTNAWIIFPFEKREMGELLTQKWQKFGLQEEQINHYLKNMGLVW
ncbi:phosphoribosyltransferase [Candidatus Woesebacteria bacterium]|nr:phosphoribosyltransferase [Candidatus Woesebacteria bacterium]